MRLADGPVCSWPARDRCNLAWQEVLRLQCGRSLAVRFVAVVLLLSTGCRSGPGSASSPSTPVHAGRSEPTTPAEDRQHAKPPQTYVGAPAELPPQATDPQWPAMFRDAVVSNEGAGSRSRSCFASSPQLNQTACIEFVSMARGHLHFVNLDLVLLEDQNQDEVLRVSLLEQGLWSDGEMDKSVEASAVSSSNRILADGGFFEIPAHH